MRALFILMLISCFCGARARAEGGSGRSVEEGTVYVPIGKRDPFKRPVNAEGTGRDVSALSPLEKFALDQFQLRAILRGTARAQAMFEDPEGHVHIVSEGTVVGRERGTISRILNREVIVTERTINYLGVTSLFERVLSLPAEDEVDQSARTPITAKGGGAGGPDASKAGDNPVTRNLTRERQGAAGNNRAGGAAGAAAAAGGATRATAPPPPPPPPPVNNNPNTSMVPSFGAQKAAPPPPPAPPTYFQGGKGSNQ